MTTLAQLMAAGSSARARGRGALSGRGSGRAGGRGRGTGRFQGTIGKRPQQRQQWKPRQQHSRPVQPYRPSLRLQRAASSAQASPGDCRTVVGVTAAPSLAQPGDCLISGSTDVSSAAGFIRAKLRENCPPVVRAANAQNVNVALKALASAHGFLEEDGLDLYVQVDFPEFAASARSTNVALHCFNKSRRHKLARVSEQIFVSGTSDPAAVAKYVAASARDAQLGRICVTACGPQPVLRALKAIYLARHALREWNLDLSITVRAHDECTSHTRPLHSALRPSCALTPPRCPPRLAPAARVRNVGANRQRGGPHSAQHLREHARGGRRPLRLRD